jgi:nondiscriminating aspartyl-tRNA synthetase
VSKGKYGDLPVVGAAAYKAFGQKRYQLQEVGALPEGTEVLVRCNVANARSQSAKLAFLNLRDTLHSIQAVVAASETLSRQLVKFAATLSAETIVDVIGTLKEPHEPVKSATISNRELHIAQVWIISKAVPQLPIQIEDVELAIPIEGAAEDAKAENGRPVVSMNTRLDNRVLDIRSTLNHAILQVQSGVGDSFYEFLKKRGFMSIHSPKILGSPSEGGSEVFEVKYFNTKAYLAQSPQLYKQMMIAGGHKRVMETAPVFRAENSNTSRHLTEYTSLDLEMEFVDDYSEVMHVIRDLLHHILTELGTTYSNQTERVRQSYPTEPFKLPADPKDIPILTFSEGIKMLNEAGIEAIDDGEADINSTQEKKLGDLVSAKFNTDFYILKEYPLKARAFYTFPKDGDATSKYSHSFDFMMRGQEVLSGAQRIHNHDMLVNELKSRGIPITGGLTDYVRSFSYGCPPHGGGAFGLERIVCNYLGLPNVRLGTLFPRDPSRLSP